MKKTPLVIGIAGGTGSGKTTVTTKILGRLDVGKVVLLRHDFYYKDLSAFDGVPPERINFDHPNALESALLVEHLIHIEGLEVDPAAALRLRHLQEAGGNHTRRTQKRHHR